MDYKTLLHPYRFLITASLGEKAASVKELQDRLPNIPQATMYRSIQKLTEANIIKPISEKKVKGAVQVTYGLNISMEKMLLEGESVETYLNAAYTVFFSYVHNKIAEHRTKKTKENNIDLSKFNSVKLHIKKDKLDEFTKATRELIQKYSTEEGDIYQLTTFLVPDANGEKSVKVPSESDRREV
jgi:predicted transcriptional regulator